MNNRIIEEFMLRIKDMRFETVDELFIKKNKIRSKFETLDIDSKEIYKWYFFFQLCLLKNPLKALMWDYICGRDNLLELNHEYILFCNRRDRIYTS